MTGFTGGDDERGKSCRTGSTGSGCDVERGESGRKGSTGCDVERGESGCDVERGESGRKGSTGCDVERGESGCDVERGEFTGGSSVVPGEPSSITNLSVGCTELDRKQSSL